MRRGVEGLIVHAVQPDESLGELLNHTRIPIILFQRHLTAWNRDALVTEDNVGSRLVMDHLLGLGHRRIGLIGGQTYPSHASGLREKGYRASLKSAGLPVDEALIRDGNYTFEGAYEASRALLQLPDPPTAFFNISDRMALGRLAAVQDEGLRVPQDVSLVGYDNLELLNYVRPRLTTVDHDGRESGRRLARRLLERIKAPELAPEKLVSEPKLLVRETSGMASFVPAPR